jgi:hypothetical protein
MKILLQAGLIYRISSGVFITMTTLGVPDYLGKDFNECGFVDKVYAPGGELLPHVVGQFFCRKEGGRILQVEVYKSDGQTIYCCWKFQDEEGCIANAVITRDGWSQGLPGNPEMRLVLEDRKIVGLKIKKSGGGEEEFTLKKSFFE